MSSYETLQRSLVAVLIALALTAGCAEDSSSRQPVKRVDMPAADVFSSEDVLQVELQVDDSDWSQIREEGRTLDQVYSRCRAPFEYSLVPAQAALDGEPLGRIALRKKGFLGSLSMVKPSLRLELSAYQSRAFRGAKELTLNNSRTDGSLLRQCLAYHVFETAGFAASRCSFARVKENDVDLGIYVNVEPIKKRMLRRFFDNEQGNLYEGNSSSDFRTHSIDFFEKKNDDPDRSDLEAVQLALAEPDDEAMLAALDPILDVDKYLRFWAIESLISQGDGYSGNMNNFYLYHDPSSDKLVFIPWGTDATFSSFAPFMTTAMNRPPITLATALLPRRLYAYAPTRARYYETLREVLDSVWDEQKLLAKIEQMQQLLGDSAPEQQIEALREFVRGRRETAEQELSDADSGWTFAERAAPVCNKSITSPLTASFEATWGKLDDPKEDPELRLDLSIDGERRTLESVKVGVGAIQNMSGRKVPGLRFVAPFSDDDEIVISFQMPLYPSDAPVEMPLHGLETFGSVQLGKPMAYTSLGVIGGGKISFDAVSTSDGERVSGRIEAEFTQRNPSPARMTPKE